MARSAGLALAGFLASCSSPPPEAPQPGIGLHDVVVRTHTPSPPAEAAAHEVACSKGDVVMCHALALDHFYSPRSPEHDAAALAAFKKACDGGYAPSCNGMGVMYDEGRGVPKDEAKAAELYRSSCAAGASTGCEHLAFALEAGRGVAKDPAAATAAKTRSECLFEADVHDAGPCPALP
jgi:hypothetical protein